MSDNLGGAANAPTTETRRFKAHDNLLISVMREQAGSIEKAVLEGAMNSIDARATRCDVTIQPYSLSITDDGRGIAERREIEAFFETFGTPHAEGDAKFGKFRMGRGQIFNFGRNTWRTGEFKMFVDLNERGLDYDLTSGLDAVQGCAIDVQLYEGLGQREIAGIRAEVGKMLKYVDETVTVNGVQVNTPPEASKFPQSNEDAFIRLTDGNSLDVYNRGVFVKSYGKWVFGCAGVLVSKVALPVNFARNDVLKSNPVWKRIQAAIDQRAVERVKTKYKLSEGERANVIARIVAGEMQPREAFKMQLFVDTSGKAWSAQSIRKRQFPQFSASYAGDPVADKLTASGQCLVFDSEVLALFECGPAEVFTRYDFFGYYGEPPRSVGYAEAKAGLTGATMAVAPHLWTPREREWLAVLEKMGYYLAPSYKERRRLRVGMSDTSEVWTDGRSHITLAREFLSRFRLTKYDAANAPDLFKVGLRLAGMYCHRSDSQKGHTDDFYRDFYEKAEMVAEAVKFVSSMLTPAAYKKLQERAKREVASERKAAGVAPEQESDAEVEQAAAESAHLEESESEQFAAAVEAVSAHAPEIPDAPAPGDDGLFDVEDALRLLDGEDDNPPN